MASALETLCGQAYGAKKYHMMGVYMQRSWIVLLVCALLLTPMYFFAEDLLLLTGQPPELSAMAGRVSVWFVPLHFSLAFLFPLQRFLQCQRKNLANAIAAAAVLCIHLFVSWLFVSRLKFGLAGVAITLSLSWWAITVMLFVYVTCGGCPETWHGFTAEAFAGLWEFVKLSAASGVMLWYVHFFDISFCFKKACNPFLTKVLNSRCGGRNSGSGLLLLRYNARGLDLASWNLATAI